MQTLKDSLPPTSNLTPLKDMKLWFCYNLVVHWEISETKNKKDKGTFMLDCHIFTLKDWSEIKSDTTKISPVKLSQDHHQYQWRYTTNLRTMLRTVFAKERQSEFSGCESVSDIQCIYSCNIKLLRYGVALKKTMGWGKEIKIVSWWTSQSLRQIFVTISIICKLYIHKLMSYNSFYVRCNTCGSGTRFAHLHRQV